MKLFFIILISLLSLSENSYGEISSKAALKKVFDGCVQEEDPDIQIGNQYEYCACFIKKISLGMDLEELMVLGMDVLSAENEEQGERIVISNQKVKKYITKCAIKLYQ